METLRKYLVDFIILFAFVVILVSEVVPWSITEPAIVKNQESPLPQNAAQPGPRSLKKSAPVSIASAFGVRPVSVVRDTKPLQESVVWINYLGYVVGENSQKKYFFKDSRSNEVLTLILGEQNGKGWKLAAVGDKFYTIENKGNTYKVPK